MVQFILRIRHDTDNVLFFTHIDDIMKATTTATTTTVNTAATLFIIFIAFVLALIVYLICCQYYNQRVRRKNANVSSNDVVVGIPKLEEIFKRSRCADDKNITYCARDSDCAQICQSDQYKCGPNNTCTQFDTGTTQPQTIECNRKYGFYPILSAADELFAPQWICLNTRPQIFNSKQQFHKYICDGSDQLDPNNLFETCVCRPGKIKVRDEFRDIPLCVYRNQLPLFPNFTPITEEEETTTNT